jgi:hypothetical protein
VHLGDGLNKVYAHGRNEPGWKAGNPPKTAQKVWIANCYSAATVGPWVKQRTYLGAGGVVQRGQIAVPQTLLIREYFRAANRIDIHNQYRQGLLAIERTWKTKSWELRLFQTVMGITLVNGYLAFKYLTDKEMTLREFTNSVALTMCAKVVEGTVLLRRQHAAHGSRPWKRRWLEPILVTCSTLCSTGELSALAQPVEKGGAGFARLSVHLVYARRAQPVLIRTGRSLSGSATPAAMAGSAIDSICMLRSECELGLGG